MVCPHFPIRAQASVTGWFRKALPTGNVSLLCFFLSDSCDLRGCVSHVIHCVWALGVRRGSTTWKQCAVLSPFLQ